MPTDKIRFKIQRRVGYSMIVGLVVASMAGFFIRVILRGLPVLNVLFSEYVLLILVFTIPAYITTVIDSKLMRAVQVCVFFVLGVAGMIFNVGEPSSMIEVYFFVCGIILSLQYGYLKKFLILKAVIFFLLFSFLKIGIGYFLNRDRFFANISPIYASPFYFYIIWVAFAEEINDYAKETKELKEQIDQNQIFVTFGKNVGGVTHNLRNKIMAIQSFNELMAESDDSEVRSFCKLQQDVIDESFRLITNLTMAMKAKQDPEQKVIDFNQIIRSVVDLFDSNSQFHQEVKVEMDLVEDGYIFMSPLDASQVVENLLRNAWEAKGDVDLLDVDIQTTKSQNRFYFTISDKGVGIPQCKNCQSQEDCNNCKLFKIGKTTKPSGSGIGMVFIMEILKMYNGHLKIISRKPKGTTIRLSFKAETRNQEYFRD